MERENVLDYDDLLLFWAEMASDPELGPELGALFDHVLADEYQDTNRLQVPNRFFIKQQAQMGGRHVVARRTRFIGPAMLKHYEERTWVNADTPHSRKPMPDAVRMLVRERARNAWK